MMSLSDVEGRYLRPAGLKDRLESSWRDGQHVWLRKTDGTFELVALLGEGEGEQREEGMQEVELPDKSVQSAVLGAHVLRLFGSG